MGFKVDPSDNQIARVIEVLSPFVPGLTVESPVASEEVPPAYSVAYVAPAVGRPKLDDNACKSFATEVRHRLEQSAGKMTRANLYARIAKENATRGCEPSTSSKAERWDARGRELMGWK